MKLTRRTFQKTLLLSALASGCASRTAFDSKAADGIAGLKVAIIGIGSRGETVLREVLRTGAKVTALCDPDSSALTLGGDGVEIFQHAKPALYRDYRILFAREKGLDAVFICTPDHHHCEIALCAIASGASVHVEPPAATTVKAWRKMAAAAKKAGLLLAVGKADLASETETFAKRCLANGVTGRPRKIIAWTNQPLWPQGIRIPAGYDALPRNLDWELWTGRDKLRPWREGYYLKGAWRAWRAFGSGAWGAVAPHLLRLPFEALKITESSAIETLHKDPGLPGAENESFPVSQSLRFTAKYEGDTSWFSRAPELEIFWHDGTSSPRKFLPLPDELKNVKLPSTGCLICGDSGYWLSSGPTGEKHAFAISGENVFTDALNHPACSIYRVPHGDGRTRPPTQFKIFLEKIARKEFSLTGEKSLYAFNEAIAKGIDQ